MVTDSQAGDGFIVPAAGRERYLWDPADAGLYSRSELRRQRGPYESTLPAQIAEWRPTFSGSVSADVEDATRALLDFDAHARGALGVDDPAAGPMSAILLRTEAVSSSQIENLTTSARQLALAELDQTSRSNAMTVIGNVRAMEAALSLAERIDEAAILAMHREMLSRQPGFERHAGVFRDQLVWIGKDNAGPRGADFVAPQPQRVPAAMRDLVVFASRDDLPVLVQVAVAHAQFETVHPFVDGNGRTGRAFAQALLRNKGIASHTTVPLSAGLLTDTGSYFDALTAYRDGDPGPIVARFADAARFATVTGRHLVDELAAQLADGRGKLVGVRPQAAVWTVLPRLVGQPVVTTAYLVETLGLNKVTAGRTLDLLTARGVLSERTGMRRNRIWQHTGILDVLDEYAHSIRRD
jgi:Fic family protein